MKFLLDAHAFLWWVTGSEQLSEAARRAIADPTNDIAVGIGALWEITIKRALRKLEFASDFETALRDEGFDLLPIRYDHLRVLETLPLHHSDPFDRLLIAQSIADRSPVITNDRSFSRYPVTTLW